MSIGSVANHILARSSKTSLVRHLCSISSYHRIQGSKGLLEAAKYIRDVLEDMGCSVELLKFSYSTPPRWALKLVGWDISAAGLWVVSPYERRIQTFPELPTSVVAHSPGGSFEGELKVVRGDESEWGDLSDSVVLASWRGTERYLSLCKRGAKAVLFYRPGAPKDAVPYLSLFLSPEDLSIAKAPAFSISVGTAVKLRVALRRYGKVVLKGFVNSSFTDPCTCPVVSASFGRGGREAHMTAHYCHAAGLINDNASGAATLIAVAESLAKDDDGIIREGMLRLLWVPEYWGSLSYLQALEREGSLGHVTCSINLDMIGEAQRLTGSTLLMVRPPIHMLDAIEPLTLKALNAMLGVLGRPWGFTNGSQPPNFSITNFSSGSDHEPYVAYGIPSVSLINWPDRYYHTNLDDVSKFDPNLALRVAAAATEALVRRLKGEGVDVRNYVRLVRGLDVMRVSSNERLAGLRDVLYREGIKAFTEGPKPSKVLSGVPGFRRLLKSVESWEACTLRRLSSKRWFRSALTLAIALFKRGVGCVGCRLALQAELGVRITEGEYNAILSALERLGAIAF